MAELKKMYAGKANSPETYLKEKLVLDGTVLYVLDGTVFPELPALVTIGNDHSAELIEILSKRSDSGYNIRRAVEGMAKTWDKGTEAYRAFSNYDYTQLIENINRLNLNKVEKEENAQLMTTEQAEKLSKIEEEANKTEYIDNLLSTDTKKALSANQGKILKQEIDKIIPPGGTTGQVLKKNSSGYSWQKDNDTTYSNATPSTSGLMSSSDKMKLNSVETGANRTIVINNLTATSTTQALSAAQGANLRAMTEAAEGTAHQARAAAQRAEQGVAQCEVEIIKRKEQIILTEAAYNSLGTSAQNDPTKLYFIEKS